MSESITLTDTDQSIFRTQDSQRFIVHRVGTAVMSNLENVHIFCMARRDDLRHDARLGIAGQHCRESVTFDQCHHAGFVCCRVGHALLRPDHAHGDASQGHDVADGDLSDLVGDPVSLLANFRSRFQSSLRQDDLIHVDDTFECRETTRVVIVQMREHDRIDATYADPQQRFSQYLRIRAGIDEQCAWSVAYQDRVALSHIQHDKLLSASHRWSNSRSHHDRQPNQADDPRHCGMWCRPYPPEQAPTDDARSRRGWRGPAERKGGVGHGCESAGNNGSGVSRSCGYAED
jgi:hypothetical protein